MKRVKTLSVRFYENKPRDKNVWDNLRNIDKKKYHTVNNAVIEILSEHFTSQQCIKNNQNTENHEREERFASEVLSILEKAMDKEIPKFLSACFSGIIQLYTSVNNGRSTIPVENSVSENSDTNTADFDTDFLGG